MPQQPIPKSFSVRNTETLFIGTDLIEKSVFFEKHIENSGIFKNAKYINFAEFMELFIEYPQ